MKYVIPAALLAALMLTMAPPVQAGPIDRACMSSPRKQKSPQLCRCIQQVANATLTRGEQRKAAKFFRDPHKAQETRQSDNPANERFWKRYKAFGSQASQTCS